MAINFPANPTDGQQFSDEGVGYVYRADCSAWVGVVQTQSVPLAVADGGTGATAAAGARTNLGLGTLATRNSVAAAQIDANAVGASELNVAGNGASGQLLRSDGDGTMTWVNAPVSTGTFVSVGSLDVSREGGTASATATLGANQTLVVFDLVIDGNPGGRIVGPGTNITSRFARTYTFTRAGTYTFEARGGGSSDTNEVNGTFMIFSR